MLGESPGARTWLLTAADEGAEQVAEKQAALYAELAEREEECGPASFEVSEVLVRLAAACSDQPSGVRERDLLARVLAVHKIIEQRVGGPDVDDGACATIHVNLADALGSIGRRKEQKEILERALQLQLKCHGPHALEVAYTLANMGNVHGARGDQKARKHCLERALSIKQNHYGRDHVEVARTLVNLANAIAALGDRTTQKFMLERALKQQEAHYGSEHLEVARTRASLACAYGALGDPDRKLAMLKLAVEAKLRICGPDHLEVATTIVNLANAHGERGDPEMQRQLLKRALAIQERWLGPLRVEVAVTCFNLGVANAAVGDELAGKLKVQRALTIFIRNFGASHPHVVKAKQWLAREGKAAAPAEIEPLRLGRVRGAAAAAGFAPPTYRTVMSHYANVMPERE